MSPEFKFALGCKVTDSVTGLTGTITARAQYTHAPKSYLLEAMDQTGRPMECWYAEDRLSEVAATG
jgi:hypothetical protein